jgi:hypothetical protein
MGSGVQLGPLGTAATNRPIVPVPGDYDTKIGGTIGRGNRSTRRKPAPLPLCPPQTPHAARTRSQAAAVGSQRLTALATARPSRCLAMNIYSNFTISTFGRHVTIYYNLNMWILISHCNILQEFTAIGNLLTMLHPVCVAQIVGNCHILSLTNTRKDNKMMSTVEALGL